MAAYQVLTTQPDFETPGEHNDAQIDLIWAMGLVNLESNNGELILPAHMATYLSFEHIEDLKLRLR